MRSLNLNKSTQKETTQSKISKKHKPLKSTLKTLGIAKENLECINEAVRIHKSKRNQSSWKLIPKDSCEVYRERRRRQLATNRSRDDEEGSFSDSLNSRQKVYKRPKKNQVKANTKRTKMIRRKRPCCCRSESTMDTETNSESSSSVNTIYTITDTE